MKSTPAEKFSDSDPTSMNGTFECARKHEITEKWATNYQSGNKSSRQPDNESESKFGSQRPA